MISKINSSLLKAVDTSYTVKFLLRLALFYFLFRFINWACVGLVTPEGYYSSFADHYLNYVTVIKVSIMQTGKLLAQLFGVPSLMLDDSILKVNNGGELHMEWACCGLEIMSFWAAFSLADTTPKRTKLWWCLGGLFCIWLINCIRVGFLITAKEKRWDEVLKLDQHDLFNVVAYSFVFLLMFIYYKKNKKVLGTEG